MLGEITGFEQPPPLPGAADSASMPEQDASWPLDEKIQQGVAFRGGINEERLDTLAVQTYLAFRAMRADSSREHGEGLANAIGLSQDEEAALDTRLIELAEWQNHGMVTLFSRASEEEDPTSHGIWTGRDEATGKIFKIHKFIGPIVMNNGLVRDGVTYSLLGSESPLEETMDSLRRFTKRDGEKRFVGVVAARVLEQLFADLTDRV